MSGRKHSVECRPSKGESDVTTSESGELEARSPVAESAAPSVVRKPLTERDWRELLQVVLKDIQDWSEPRGRGNVPPAEFLRQLTHFVDAMGTLRYTSGGHDPRSRPQGL